MEKVSLCVAEQIHTPAKQGQEGGGLAALKKVQIVAEMSGISPTPITRVRVPKTLTTDPGLEQEVVGFISLPWVQGNVLYLILSVGICDPKTTS